MITLADLADRLDGVRWRGDLQIVARCPAHDDRRPSLSARQAEDGRVLVYCHAGCSFEAIVAALGLTARDLAPPDDPGRPRPVALPPGPGAAPAPAPAKAPRPPRAGPPRITDYVIRDAAGQVVAIHRRRDWPLASGGLEKEMIWLRPDGSPGLAGRRSETLPLYGSERLAALPPGATIIVTEGEKAARALIDAGLPAVGTVTGAATAPAAEALAALAGRDVVIWPDADAAGRRHMELVAERLAGLGATVRWFAWRGAPPGGDAADWLARPGADPAVLAALVENAPDWSPPPAPAPAPAPAGADGCPACRRQQAEIERWRRAYGAMRAVAARRLRLALAALARERAVRAVATHPYHRGRAGAVLALAAEIAAAPPEARRDDGYVRVAVWRVARAAGASEDTVSATVAALRAAGAVEAAHDYRAAADAGGERVIRRHLLVRLPDLPAERAGDEAAVAQYLAARSPRRPRCSAGGATHGGRRERIAPLPPPPPAVDPPDLAPPAAGQPLAPAARAIDDPRDLPPAAAWIAGCPVRTPDGPGVIRAIRPAYLVAVALAAGGEREYPADAVTWAAAGPPPPAGPDGPPDGPAGAQYPQDAGIPYVYRLYPQDACIATGPRDQSPAAPVAAAGPPAPDAADATRCVACDAPAAYRGGDGQVRCRRHALFALGGLSRPLGRPSGDRAGPADGGGRPAASAAA